MNKADRVSEDILRRLSRAREFIDDCYAEQIDLNQISGQACFSQFHFLRLFRDIYKITPYQYLTERRIQRAKELLSSTGMSVTEVCLEVGFQSLGSFSSLFRKHVGAPPLRYRARVLVQVNGLRSYLLVPACFVIMFGPQASSPE